MSSDLGLIDVKMAQTKPDQPHSPSSPYDILSTVVQKLAFDEFASLESATVLKTDCSCEACKNKNSVVPESLEDVKIIQTCWLELRQYIRIVYRLSMKGSLKSIDDEYQSYMKDIVSKLFDICDPHHLYQKIEAQVKEFIIEIKVLLLQILDRMSANPRLPQIFISGMLDRYNKIMNAATVMSPVLCQLEEKHLSQFSLTWKMLNKRLFQSVIYSDIFFQNSVPIFISQLGKGKRASEHKGLVKDFLTLDKEIGVIEGQWVEIQSSILKYLRIKTNKSDKRLKFLIPDWGELRTLKKLENIAIIDNPVFGFNGKRVPIDSKAEGVQPEILANACECHLCLDAPHHHHHHLHHHHHHHAPVELIEQVIPLGAHRGAFHLYPPIHATKGVPEFPFLPECDLPEICGKMSEQQFLKKYPGAGKAPKLNKIDHTHGISKHLHHHHSNIKKRVDKATQKDQDVVCSKLEDKLNLENHKNTPRVAHIKDHAADITHLAHHHPHVHCSKHTDVKRIPFPPERHHDDDAHHTDDLHSEHSGSDPRHCDCCYCEVFGHGVPTSPAAPMSRNYQEMRERLRLLLNKKKSKCKSNPTTTPQAQAQPQTQAQRKQQTPGTTTTNSQPEGDTRALEDLLEFIEGNEVKCRNEKKAAKKARQKEKKRILMIRKKREEEEKEKARLLEEALQKKKREEALAKELQEKARLNNSNKKKKNNSKATTTTTTNNNKNKNYSNNLKEVSKDTAKPGPQMVTIKRVMEPHNSEPTVTITLRGATPNQDRVLYTLLNGQVCKMKDGDRKKTSGVKNGSNNISAKTNAPNISSKLKEVPPKEKPHLESKPKNTNMRHESSKQPAPMPIIKPSKELTNPTSIQINNAVNNLSKKNSSSSASFNINDIKLPPGITITKVDPSTVNQSRSSKMLENAKKANNNPPRPPSEVIVVSTGKRKDTPTMKEPIIAESQGRRNKKNKKKAALNNPGDGKGTAAYPGLEIQPVKFIDTNKDNRMTNRMSVLTISPYGNNEQTDQTDSNKKKKKKPKKSDPCNTINPEEWNLLDSVFAPKDIDLDDNEIDDAERELEAFKRFCLQSIPPERKEKVHLNIKDIVLKKKATTYNY